MLYLISLSPQTGIAFGMAVLALVLMLTAAPIASKIVGYNPKTVGEARDEQKEKRHFTTVLVIKLIALAVVAVAFVFTA